ncbi:hypothetical protein [Streptomyces sp. NPDC014733]|uniref:hypothetical protein n=1 Tax=Streptomyces sp. NPDC014733 TaxID=3364885 RepID=UPI0036FB09C0
MDTAPRPGRTGATTRPASAPAAPARPTAPPAPSAPPRPAAAPAAAPGFRDTAAYHLARSQGLWAPGGGAAPRTRAATRGPGAGPPPGRSGGPFRPRTPLPPQAAGPLGPPRPLSAPRRPISRAFAAAACLVLGTGLLCGAVAGSWLTEGADTRTAAQIAYDNGRDAWHNAPVDALFPPVVDGLGAGPGGSDRRWTRVAVAPDRSCRGAENPELTKALAPAGCIRQLRATYVDATRTDLVTVGVRTARADQDTMKALRHRFAAKGLADDVDLMPRTYAPEGTPAAPFGADQRATWTVRVLTDIPVVVSAVAGFADGRTVTTPQPAADAVRPGTTTVAAEAGLGHDAKGLADRIEATFRAAAGSTTRTTEASP